MSLMSRGTSEELALVKLRRHVIVVGKHERVSSSLKYIFTWENCLVLTKVELVVASTVVSTVLRLGTTRRLEGREKRRKEEEKRT